MTILDGKVALITGGASGMGRAGALLFAKEGAKVVIADVNDKMAAETVQMAKDADTEVRYVRADMTNMSDLGKMVSETVKAFGKLDIFWHNAGNVGPGIIEKTSEQDYDLTMNIHAKAGFFGAKFAVAEMKKAGGGSILFTASVSGLKPNQLGPVYSMAKASQVMLTRALAAWLGRDNIRVNCICPGMIETPLTPEFMGREPDIVSPEKNKQISIKTIPLKRIGEPEEIAAAALFLVSDAASYITGVPFPVDGGLTTR